MVGRLSDGSLQPGVRCPHNLIDPANTTLDTRDMKRRNNPHNWAIPTSPAYPTQAGAADIITAQGTRPRHNTAPHREHAPTGPTGLAGLLPVRARVTDSGDTAPDREHAPAGLLRCGPCERVTDSCSSHGCATHRCRPQARAVRQRDTKILNDVSESAVARRLFHGLNPTADQEQAEGVDVTGTGDSTLTEVEAISIGREH